MSTLVFTLLTFWPPAPDDLANWMMTSSLVMRLTGGIFLDCLVSEGVGGGGSDGGVAVHDVGEVVKRCLGVLRKDLFVVERVNCRKSRVLDKKLCIFMCDLRL
jgi:intein/homing endonuclease